MTFATCAALSLLLAAAAPTPPGCGNEPCEPGYRWVEEDSFVEVERYVCKVVPDVKKVKKIIYTTKENPFCVRKCDCKKSCGEAWPWETIRSMRTVPVSSSGSINSSDSSAGTFSSRFFNGEFTGWFPQAVVCIDVSVL